jgi:hypothetical protein
VRERLGGHVRVIAEPEQLEQAVGPLPCGTRAPADAERRHLDVLAHRELPE